MNNYKPSIRYGLYLGAGLILFHVIAYAVNPELFFNQGYGIAKMMLTWGALPILFMILGARDCVPNFEDYTFGKAFKAALLVAVVAIGLNTIYEITINIVDPEFSEWIYDTAIDKQMESFEDQDLPEERLEQQRKGGEMVRPYFTGITGAVITNIGLFMWFLVLALIVGAIQKKN